MLHQSPSRLYVSGEQTSSPLWLGLPCCSELWQGKTGTRSCMTAWFSLRTARQQIIIGRQTVGTSLLRSYTSAHFMLSLLTLCWTSWLVSALIYVECGCCWWKIWGFHGNHDNYCSLLGRTTVSEECSASIFRPKMEALCCPKMLVLTSQCHIPEGHSISSVVWLQQPVALSTFTPSVIVIVGCILWRN